MKAGAERSDRSRPSRPVAATGPGGRVGARSGRPGDVAIVGYDDISVAGELITPLTSVHQPMRDIGWAAADLLLADGGAVRHVSFVPELVVRESTVAGAP